MSQKTAKANKQIDEHVVDFCAFIKQPQNIYLHIVITCREHILNTQTIGERLFNKRGTITLARNSYYVHLLNNSLPSIKRETSVIRDSFRLLRGKKNKKTNTMIFHACTAVKSFVCSRNDSYTAISPFTTYIQQTVLRSFFFFFSASYSGIKRKEKKKQTFINQWHYLRTKGEYILHVQSNLFTSDPSTNDAVDLIYQSCHSCDIWWGSAAHSTHCRKVFVVIKRTWKHLRVFSWIKEHLLLMPICVYLNIAQLVRERMYLFSSNEYDSVFTIWILQMRTFSISHKQ